MANIPALRGKNAGQEAARRDLLIRVAKAADVAPLDRLGIQPRDPVDGNRNAGRCWPAA
jgi:hypothetical protein